LNDWDDFQVADPSVVRTRDDWRMYYVGARLDENGYASAIGVAVSDDGRTWRKDPRNPLILPDEPLESRTTRRLLTPAVSVLADGSWLMACVELDHNEGRRGLRVLRSPDGFDWRIDHDAERSLRQAASSQALVSPSVCPNPHRRERIQLWCLKSRDANRVADVRNAAIVMLQSTDGTSWKQLLERPFTEIEPTGFVRDVRVAVEKDRWQIGYLFQERDSGDAEVIRLRRSADGIRWTPAGVPDFSLPRGRRGDDRLAAASPAMAALGDEIALYFTEQQDDGIQRIIAAVCPLPKSERLK
jgi:hypothetical protein